MFDQPFFCEGPESFDTIDVDLSLFEFITVINIEMTIPAEHKRIIPSPFIGVDDRSSSYFLIVSDISDSAFTSVTILTETFPPRSKIPNTIVL